MLLAFSLRNSIFCIIKLQALCDDFDTPKAVTALQALVGATNVYLKAKESAGGGVAHILMVSMVTSAFSYRL
jgi:cysteinyl-tRNA synthetase